MTKIQLPSLSTCEEARVRIKDGVQFMHLSIPNPPTIERTKEDFFIFEENGKPVLLEVSARSPLQLSPVNRAAPGGLEKLKRVREFVGEVARLLQT